MTEPQNAPERQPAAPAKSSRLLLLAVGGWMLSVGLLGLIAGFLLRGEQPPAPLPTQQVAEVSRPAPPPRAAEPEKPAPAGKRMPPAAPLPLEKPNPLPPPDPPGPAVPTVKVAGAQEWTLPRVMAAAAPLRDGKRVLLGGTSFILLDLETGQVAQEYPLSGGGQVTASIAVTPDGKRFFGAAATNKLIYCWEVESGKPLGWLSGHVGTISGLALTSDGKILVSAGDKTVRLWDTATFAELAKLQGHKNGVTAVAVAPDGSRAVSCSGTEVILWDLQTRKALQVRTVSGLRGLAYTPDGRSVVAADRLKKSLAVLDAANLRETRRVANLGEISGELAFSPDGQSLLAGAPKEKVHILTWPALARVGSFLADPKGSVGGLSFSPDGQFFYAVGNVRVLRRWPAADLRAVAAGRTPAPAPKPLRLEHHTDAVTSLALSPDGKQLYSGGLDATVCTWDAATGQLGAATSVSSRKEVRSLSVSPAQTLLAVCLDSEVLLLDLKTQRWSSKVGWETAPGAFWLTPEALYLATPTRTEVRHLDTGVREVAPSQFPVSVLIPSPSRKWLMTLSNKGDHLHELRGGAGVPDGRQQLGAGATCAAFSPDESLIAVGGEDHVIRIYDLKTRKAVKRLAGHGGPVRCVCFSPDGGRLLSGGDDKALILWDVKGGELRRFADHGGPVSAVVWAADGRSAFAAAGTVVHRCPLEQGD